jgi:Sulfotransferase domain
MHVNNRRVPDMIVGGAPRSGTTLSCEILSLHPDIHVLKPFIPEPKVCLLDLGPHDEAYLDRYAQLFADAPESSCYVEKTSNYWENSLARERLARMLPHTRFIFILREPVARAYSNWRWSRQNGLETLPFDQAFDRSERPSPLPPRQVHARPFDYLPRSEYGRLASEWIAAIGLQRIRFYLFERVTTDIPAWAADLFAYAGVRSLPGTAEPIGVINAANDQSPIDQGLEQELRSRIRPEVIRFAELTGVDVSCWGY